MNQPLILLPAYIANIAILIPVCWAMLFGEGEAGVFEDKVPVSPGLRQMVGSLWSAILVISMAGLVFPQPCWLILVVQVVYKSLWLLTYVLPLWFNHEREKIPQAISATFLIICLTYPVLIFLAWSF